MVRLASEAVRVRARVRGTVQGVGFRPFVYRLAYEEGLAGYVLNDEHGVLLEVEGPGEAVARFLLRIRREPPPLAAIQAVHTDVMAMRGESGFSIVASARGGPADAPVTADSAPCSECLAELLDPADRRYRYPFINCTNCGPRFTIITGVPYDRASTTMAGFEMCRRCRREYEDPLDRRFHAQPNACPACGPHVWLAERSGARRSERDAALADAAAAIRAGAIVAIKGLGGFHLACAAASEEAVATLRARKHRDEKPFALMAADLDAARALVELTAREQALLTGRERPIVVARGRPDAPVAASVAPCSPELGVMLPYTPLHRLLVGDAGETLVMTSGNVSDEPIAYRDDDALGRLGEIADMFLLHDRPIETRTDDSVVRAISGRSGPLLIRRSRGYVPEWVPLPVAAGRPLLAVGAELKNTFCVAKGSRAWVSHHIGDLENYETLESFTDGITHFERLFAVEPEAVAHDLHPEYLSTKYALARDRIETIGVQHHHAHLAACLGEHRERCPAIGAIFDGTGYGTDGTIWGGELLVGDLRGFERAGHLWPAVLPGGARAIREPWRMARAWLAAAHCDLEPPRAVARRDWEMVARLIESGVACPRTTSVGRLFDAVAALCGLRPRVTYEGQAAVELEAACDPHERDGYPLPLVRIDGRLVLDARETVRAVVRDLRAGAASGTIAARFHNALAAATICACVRLAGDRDLGTVVLAGGTFQNRRVLEAVAAGLRRAGLRVLVPARLPPGDGGISFGQAAVAAARIADGDP
ncbi:MAG TPA: carbamoyltransferase HypF [Solirubrobacteraceae bacterium]|nr:carbamoyltransferase HypF [Solirubrobacteraceae bacterium]